MDKIRPFGRGIVEVIEPTFRVYGDLLRQPANAAAIHAAKVQTFAYGAHDRQKLDIYTPSSNAPKPRAGKPRPILMFAYGGGFISGDKVMAAIPGEVAYTNLGYFFAEKLGFETIVMDYRLLSHGAKYPSGGDDVGGVMDWVEARYGSDATGYNGERELFMMGNSAGAVHVLTWLFAQHFIAGRNILFSGDHGVRLNGVVLLGCPLRWDVNGSMKNMLATYYGGTIEAKAAEPTALMERATGGIHAQKIRKWPRMLTVASELDPEDHMLIPGKEFARMWRERGGRGKFLELKGHNHLSPPLSLGTGIEREEAWGCEVAAWMTGAETD